MIDRGALIRSSAGAVWLAAAANALFALAVIAGLLASVLLGDHFTESLLGVDAAADPAARTIGMRWLLLLGLAMAGAVHVLLRALGRIIATVSAGDPFIADNAARLRTIGWSLLVLQLCDLPAAAIAKAWPALGAAAPEPGMSPAGWLAVLMTFVLARIFLVGAGMRDDLEGTV